MGAGEGARPLSKCYFHASPDGAGTQCWPSAYGALMLLASFMWHIYHNMMSCSTHPSTCSAVSAWLFRRAVVHPLCPHTALSLGCSPVCLSAVNVPTCPIHLVSILQYITTSMLGACMHYDRPVT